MSDTPTLADGCPVWEGQAVLFGSGSPRGRFYVRRISANTVEVDHGHTTEPGALVADLMHRPTFIYLASLMGERFHRVTFINTDEVTWGRLGMSDYGPLPPRIRYGDPATLLALWIEVSHV